MYRLDEDAETDVLAKYIITLLGADENETPLREHCVSQLTDFLSDDAESFVAALFDAIKSKLPLYVYLSCPLFILVYRVALQRRTSAGCPSVSGTSVSTDTCRCN